jgi:hypothetical protein
MKGNQIGILAAYPTPRELPLSNWTWFNDHVRSAFEKIVGDGSAHLTKANETEFHVCSPALAF